MGSANPAFMRVTMRAGNNRIKCLRLTDVKMKPWISTLCHLFAFGCLSAQSNVWEPSPEHTQISIWPGAVPDAGKQPIDGPEGVKTPVTKDGIRWVAAVNVTQPTMTVYSPKETNT